MPRNYLLLCFRYIFDCNFWQLPDDCPARGMKVWKITLFCTFLCRHCTTTSWKCLISRCAEEVHKRRRNFHSLSALGYGSWEFSFRMVRLHLKKLVTWSNRDEDWKKSKNTNSLFQRRFLCRRRPRILRWLDWIFLGGYLPSLSINYVGMSKDMEKRLPQLYYIKMKISYDLGFIATGVTMAT